MIYIVYLFVLAIAFAMFRLNIAQKIGLLWVSAMCLSRVNIPFLPIHNSIDIMVLCFVISEYNRIKTYFFSGEIPFINKIVLVSLISYVIHCLTSPHLFAGDYIWWRLLINPVISMICIPSIIYAALQEDVSLEKILKTAYPGLLVLTFFGIVNFITLHSPFIDLMESVSAAGSNLRGDVYATMDRFRVQAMFGLACDYGYVSSITLLLYLFGYYKKAVNKRMLIIVLACCIFGIVVSGFRTCLISSSVSIAFFYLFAFKMSKTIKKILIVTILLLISYLIIPFVHEQIDKAISVFTLTQDQSDGSSLEMRAIQFAAVLRHISGYELFGRGMGYFFIDMGWGEDTFRSLLDTDLWGLEGEYLNQLLHRGYIGLLFYLIFIFGIIGYAYKCRYYDKLSAAFLLSIVLLYFIYSNMTGIQQSTFSTMVAIGLGMKLLDKNKYDQC